MFQHLALLSELLDRTPGLDKGQNPCKSGWFAAPRGKPDRR